MPNYQTARNGVSMSYAQLEAAAVAPVTRPMLNTYELYHPLSGRHRFVADNENLLATLEADAPADASTEVEFLAAPLTIDKPDESDTAATPETTLSLDNVSGLMSSQLDLTRGSLTPWELTERVFAGDDTSGPAILPPTVLDVDGVAIKGTALALKASFGNPNDVNVPRRTFKRSDYPGLVR